MSYNKSYKSYSKSYDRYYDRYYEKEINGGSIFEKIKSKFFSRTSRPSSSSVDWFDNEWIPIMKNNTINLNIAKEWTITAYQCIYPNLTNTDSFHDDFVSNALIDELSDRSNMCYRQRDFRIFDCYLLEISNIYLNLLKGYENGEFLKMPPNPVSWRSRLNKPLYISRKGSSIGVMRNPELSDTEIVAMSRLYNDRKNRARRKLK